MPELPEVETVVRTLEKLIKDKEISDVTVYWDNIIANKSIDEFCQQLKGEKFKEFSRKGKYLIFTLSTKVLVAHLRMEGKFYYYEKKQAKDKHTHVIFSFSDDSQLHYHDVRKFGKMYLYEKGSELSCLNTLGLEPFDDNLTVEYLKERARKRNISLKQFLLEQSNIAGIGNIYADEITFKSKLNPLTKVNSLNEEQWQAVIDNTKLVLKEAIEAGGTTVRSYTSSLGVTGLFQQNLMVYGRAGENCLVCDTPLKKITVATRGTIYCPNCQRQSDD